MNRTSSALILLALLGALAACSEARDIAFGAETGGCSDRTPQRMDLPSEGTATIVAIGQRDGERLLTFDYTASNWSTAERQDPVLARDVTGLPGGGVVLAVGDQLALRAVFHISQVCANTPTDAAPPSWTYVSGPEPG